MPAVPRGGTGSTGCPVSKSDRLWFLKIRKGLKSSQNKKVRQREEGLEIATDWWEGPHHGKKKRESDEML